MGLTVGFDATSAARQSAGIGRYTRELLSALAARNDSTRYRVFYCSGGELRGSMGPLNHRFTVRKLPVTDRVSNAVWHRMRIPIPVQAITGRVDLFHSPDFTIPPVLGVPSIVTVHDLAFLAVPDCAYPTLREYLQVVVPRSVRRASHVIAVSTSTSLDLQERLGIDSSRIAVIPEAVSGLFQPRNLPCSPEAEPVPCGISRPYILSVGTLEPRKNYVRLLQAYASLRQRGVEHDLVIAGASGWMFEPIMNALDELKLHASVHIVQPDDSQLVRLYQGAAVFVYASLYEGFGIPPLEALACGTPVACSNSSSLPEVVGDAALLFDPHDIDQIASAIERILSDRALERSLRSAGPVRASTFSWGSTAERTHALYQVISGRA